jgi:hypothetical protein
MNLVTLNAGEKHELLFNKPTSAPWAGKGLKKTVQISITIYDLKG